jgi:transposase
VYWKPAWHVLEGSVELVLANAKHIRTVPGRKTDVNDAMWIADLLAHGLIRGSFVPPEPLQHLRDLTRTRKQLVREIAQHIQRIQKTLEDANLKITGLITDEALRGRISEHHRFLLKLHLGQIEALEQAREEREQHMGKSLEPMQAKAKLLITMPGVSETVAQVILAVAASMLTAAYSMLRDDAAYGDLGADQFHRRDKTQLVKRLIRRFSDLGFQVAIRPAA